MIADATILTFLYFLFFTFFLFVHHSSFNHISVNFEKKHLCSFAKLPALELGKDACFPIFIQYTH